MKSFLIKMSNAHNEHIREVASVDEAIRIASERANEGFWLPPSRVCEMSKEHEGRYTVGDDGWFRPIELAVPVEIEEVKSSYGNGGSRLNQAGNRHRLSDSPFVSVGLECPTILPLYARVFLCRTSLFHKPCQTT